MRNCHEEPLGEVEGVLPGETALARAAHESLAGDRGGLGVMGVRIGTPHVGRFGA